MLLSIAMGCFPHGQGLLTALDKKPIMESAEDTVATETTRRGS